MEAEKTAHRPSPAIFGLFNSNIYCHPANEHNTDKLGGGAQAEPWGRGGTPGNGDGHIPGGQGYPPHSQRASCLVGTCRGAPGASRASSGGLGRNLRASSSKRGSICLPGSTKEPGFCLLPRSRGGGGRGRGLPAAWGPQNHSWILDSLTRPAVCGVTQVLLSPPAGEKTILSCPVVILALLPQSWDMVPHDPS